MKFSELESIMFNAGAKSLAEIARSLNTPPQAVSNWKARDQVPYHIISKVNDIFESHKQAHIEHGESTKSLNIIIPPKRG